jgi:hypothetical protein
MSIVVSASFINNLKLLNVRIANHTVLGSSTILECTYDLEGEHLYSVKWYKNGDEFFRYLPKSKPSIQVFEKSGIYIDVSNQITVHNKIIIHTHVIIIIMHYYLVRLHCRLRILAVGNKRWRTGRCLQQSVV